MTVALYPPVRSHVVAHDHVEHAPRWFGSAAPQRALMRDLFDRLGDDSDAVCLAYAEAERDGKVARSIGTDSMTSGGHARALWREGKLKGWLER